MTLKTKEWKAWLFQRLALLKMRGGVLKLMSYKQTLQGGSPGLPPQPGNSEVGGGHCERCARGEFFFFLREDGVDWGDGKTQQVGRCLFNLFIQRFREISPPKIFRERSIQKNLGWNPIGFTTGHPGEVHSLSTENGGLVRESRTPKMDWQLGLVNSRVVYLDLARNGKIYRYLGTINSWIKSLKKSSICGTKSSNHQQIWGTIV